MSIQVGDTVVVYGDPNSEPVTVKRVNHDRLFNQKVVVEREGEEYEFFAAEVELVRVALDGSVEWVR